MDAMDGYGGDEGMGQAAKGMKDKQVRRRAKCALALINKLSALHQETTAESGEVRPVLSMEQFLAAEATDAEELCKQPFGAMLLHAIGSMYVTKGNIWIGRHTGLGAKGKLLELQQKKHVVSTYMSTAGAAVSAFKAARKMEGQSAPLVDLPPPDVIQAMQDDEIRMYLDERGHDPSGGREELLARMVPPEAGEY
eukprot:SAG22_NODE_3918_length_1468_cov_1.471877_2_plen_195_part_00